MIQRLKSQHDGMLPKGEYAFVTKKEIAELMAEIDRLTAERDEARRMACEAMFESWKEFANNSGECGGEPWTPQRFAKEEGWDCFKEDTDE